MKPENFKTPILLVAFNRPDVTKNVFNEIRRIRPKKLFVSIDGPRNEDEKLKVDEVKKIISKVDWPCRLKKKFNKKNLGCKVAVSSAIDWFFENVNEGIILEDDCLPGKDFFKFCEVLLKKYANDERVMHISGDNFQRGWKANEYSYYFSKYPHVWGWATWKRAWKKYDINMSKYPEIESKGLLKKWYPNPIERKMTQKNFDACYYKNLNTWDYQWLFSILLNDGLTIIPQENLVKNIGFLENNSTHTRKSDSYLSVPIRRIEFPLKHPQAIRNSRADKRYAYWLFLSKLRKLFLTKGH